jgi:hypothetical protein
VPDGLLQPDGATQRGRVTFGTLTPAAALAVEHGDMPGGRLPEDKPQSLNLGIAPHATATLSMVILPQSVNVPGRCSSESKQC